MYKSGYYFVQLNRQLPAIPMYVVNINDNLYIYQSAVGKWKQVGEWDVEEITPPKRLVVKHQGEYK